MTDQIKLERAHKQDSRFIAEMIALACAGIASIEWQQQAELEPGKRALDMDAESYAGDVGDYS